MLVNGKELNCDNERDWSDKELQEFVDELSSKHSKTEQVLLGLCKNEIARRREISKINKRFNDNKEFILREVKDDKG